MADDTLHPALQPAPEPAKPGGIFSGSLGSKPAPAKTTGAERLRAFEDLHLGVDTVRHNGEIERGHGSPFRFLSGELQKEYAALERLVDAEADVADAEAAMAVAESNRATAAAIAENAGKAAEQAKADAEAAKKVA